MNEKPIQGRHVSKRPARRHETTVSGLTTQQRQVAQMRDLADRYETEGNVEFADTLRQAADGVAAQPDPEANLPTTKATMVDGDGR